MIDFFRNTIRRDFKILILSIIIPLILPVFLFHKLEIKDIAMIYLSTVFLIYELYLFNVNKKQSLILYIMTFFIMVTSRKLCLINYMFSKMTYECIFITLISILNYKNIVNYIKTVFYKHKGADFNFYVLIFLFLIFTANSVAYSSNIINSILNIYIGVFIPVLFMFNIVTVFELKDKYKLYYAIITTVDLSCLYGISQVLKLHVPISKIKEIRMLLTFGYNNINVFAGMLVITIPLLMEVILYKKSCIKEKVFQYLSITVYLIALFITYSRGAWLCFLLSVFLILISKKYKKILILFCAAGCILIKPVFSFIITRGNKNISFLTNLSSTARIQSFFTNINIMKDFPFGISIGDFADRYRQYALQGYLLIPQNLRIKMKASGVMLENAHNLLMQIGVELGIAALIIFILIFINRFKTQIKNYEINRGMFVSLVIYIIFSEITGNELCHKGIISSTLIVFLIFAFADIASIQWKSKRN